MNVLVQGTKGFNDYSVVVRAMGVALSGLKTGDKLNIMSLGPHKLNDHLIEFVNKTGKSLKSHGVSIKFNMIPISAIDPDKVDSMYFFCNNGERLSKQGQELESHKEVLVFRY